MASHRKTWKEKLETGAKPHVAPSIRKIGGFPIGSMMLICTPHQVREYVERIPRGETRSIPQMRDDLAKANGAELTCPMVAGMFARIVSEAALEDGAAGAEEITPFWRLVDPDSPLAKRLSCGPEYVHAMRELEAK